MSTRFAQLRMWCEDSVFFYSTNGCIREGLKNKSISKQIRLVLNKVSKIDEFTCNSILIDRKVVAVFKKYKELFSVCNESDSTFENCTFAGERQDFADFAAIFPKVDIDDFGMEKILLNDEAITRNDVDNKYNTQENELDLWRVNYQELENALSKVEELEDFKCESLIIDRNIIDTFYKYKHLFHHRLSPLPCFKKCRFIGNKYDFIEFVGCFAEVDVGDFKMDESLLCDTVIATILNKTNDFYLSMSKNVLTHITDGIFPLILANSRCPLNISLLTRTNITLNGIVNCIKEAVKMDPTSGEYATLGVISHSWEESIRVLDELKKNEELASVDIEKLECAYKIYVDCGRIKFGFCTIERISEEYAEKLRAELKRDVDEFRSACSSESEENEQISGESSSDDEKEEPHSDNQAMKQALSSL